MTRARDKPKNKGVPTFFMQDRERTKPSAILSGNIKPYMSKGKSKTQHKTSAMKKETLEVKT